MSDSLNTTLENIGSLSYADLPNFDPIHYNVKKKSHLLISSLISLEVTAYRNCQAHGGGFHESSKILIFHWNFFIGN